jgi:iron complex outermembrane receptor protein
VDVDANPATPGVTIPLRQQAKIWTPRFVVNYEPSEDVLLFASATRGFKSGAQSARGTVIRTLLPTTPEKVWAYELGAKTEFLDRRVRFNVTGFIQNTTDLQSGSASVNALTGALSFTTRNFAGLRNKGVEVEIQALPVENLILSLTAGFQDAKYTLNRDLPALDQFNVLSVGAQQAECLAALAGQASPRGDARTATARAASSCGNGIVGFNGALTEPVRTPKVTIAAGVSYTHDLAAWDLRVIPSVNVIYTSKQEVGTTNLSFYRSATGAFNVTGDGTFLAGSFSKAHTYVNASVAVETADNAWRVTADCSNCFGVDSVQATLSNFSYINPPGTWSVRVRRKF